MKTTSGLMLSLQTTYLKARTQSPCRPIITTVTKRRTLLLHSGEGPRKHANRFTGWDIIRKTWQPALRVGDLVSFETRAYGVVNVGLVLRPA